MFATADGQALLAFAPRTPFSAPVPLEGRRAVGISLNHRATRSRLVSTGHVSSEGRRRNRWGIALRVIRRWTIFLSWSVGSTAAVQDVIEDILVGGPLMHIFSTIYGWQGLCSVDTED